MGEAGRERLTALLKTEPDLAFRARVRRAFAYLDPKRDERVLDCGCGLGFHLMALARLTSCRVYGLDRDLASLEFARQNVQGRRVSMCLGDIYHLPYRDEYFEKVLVSEVLEHLDRDADGLHEVWRVLKPGGILVVTAPNRDYPFFYDPINWLCERTLRRPIRGGALAGAWMGHRRLYAAGDLLELMQRTGFVVMGWGMLTPSCFPFTHNLVYGLGKTLLQRRRLPRMLLKEVDRFHPEAGQRRPWNPMSWVMGAVDWLDRWNANIAGKTRFVNIAVQARKDSS